MIQNKLDENYLSLVNDIILNGSISSDRTGTGTKKVFGRQIRHNMNIGLPILTTKKMFTKGVIHELLWFLKGDTNTKYLVDNNVYIWIGDCYKYYLNNNDDIVPLSREEFINKIKSEDVNSEFNLKYATIGKGYGKQWRDFNGIDQIKTLIETLKTNPSSRRMLLNAWNVSELDEMLLVPCHYGLQLFTRELTLEERNAYYTSRYKGLDLTNPELDEINIPKYELSLMWNQRSVDVLLGLPFNILSYGIMLLMLSKEVNMIPGELIGNLGDCHLYLNQIDIYESSQKNNSGHILPKIVDTEFSRKENEPIFILEQAPDIFSYTIENFKIKGYLHNDSIQYPLSN